MKKLLLISLVLLCVCAQAEVKSNFLGLRDTPCIDFRKFGAKAEAGFDNAPALAKAATYITTNGGGITLFIPEGTFDVVPGGETAGAGNRVLWNAFELIDVDNVSIVGAPGSKITSSIDMGSASTDGQSMYLFYFENCNNIKITGLDVDVTVTGTPNTGDTTYYKLASIVNFVSDGETIGGLTIDRNTLKINNAVSGNGNGNGYKFNTVWCQGTYAINTSSRFRAKNINISNNTFPDGQGPVVWLLQTENVTLKGNRWINCGGPLHSLRLTGGYKNILVEGNYFSAEEQPSPVDVDAVVNYDISADGGYAWDTMSEQVSTNLKVVNNTFMTVSGEVCVVRGGTNFVFSDNTIERLNTGSKIGPSGSVVTNDSGYGEPLTHISIECNQFIEIPNPAIVPFGYTENLSITGNIFASCSRALWVNSLVVAPSGTSAVQNLLFCNNCVYNSSDTSLLFIGPATHTVYVTIAGNTFNDNYYSTVSSVTSGKNIYNISGNTFQNNGRATYASTVDIQSGVAKINGNLFKDNQGTDVYFLNQQSSGLTVQGSVSNNSIADCGGNGIVVSGSNIVITGNDITGVNQLSIAGNSGILVATGSAGMLVSDNRIVSPGPIADYGVYMASVTQSLAADNILYNSAVITQIATGTSGVTTHDNLF